MSVTPAVNLRKLATTELPPRLLRFFAKYPPKAILSVNQTAPVPASSLGLDTTSEHAANQIETLGFLNPFKCQKHSVTGARHDPVFSLRRQADLVKLARKHGVEELLPPTVKGTEERMRRRAENGLRVKGTGVGQRVKGKESERTMKARLEKRRQAMLEMPQMIQTWKERGHGRGWKKWPK
ncbi:hypothetical protein B0O99DRAFT_604318 [Bisporella sp. PMI_857]|nr:hypothetical protein B0O99DRAFT_604318 [Bisporella sp. PMI_857]